MGCIYLINRVLDVYSDIYVYISSESLNIVAKLPFLLDARVRKIVISSSWESDKRGRFIEITKQICQ